MIYVLLDSTLCDEKRIFKDNERLPQPDGRTVITLNEVNYIRFSLGKQELINHTDLNDLRAKLAHEAENNVNN